MCNIAGYVGKRDAAPIIIEMMRREEGFAGGYYSGLATISDSVIHHRKLTGNLNDLLSKTDAATLPGNVGIIHSRSNSGGGDEFAHPFCRFCDEKATIAYVANGAANFFANRFDECTEIAASLFKDGYSFTSVQDEEIPAYPKLPDGRTVHMSDLMAQLIARYIESGSTHADAINLAYQEMPGEIVGLLLSPNHPDSIAWSRINMPMFVGFASHGAYLASTPYAFPDDARDIKLLPAMCGGEVFPDRVTEKPYAKELCSIAPIDDETYNKAKKLLSKHISHEPKNMITGVDAIKPAFSSADIIPRDALYYQLVYDMKDELEFSEEMLDGAFNGLLAPKKYITFKK
ncbi:MAG: hypothetical protein IJO09_02030 [Oscillospiraceae bacterium]|nr:hypothetical protein [Oscillospiraceae bacterium]